MAELTLDQLPDPPKQVGGSKELSLDQLPDPPQKPIGAKDIARGVVQAATDTVGGVLKDVGGAVVGHVNAGAGRAFESAIDKDLAKGRTEGGNRVEEAIGNAPVIKQIGELYSALPDYLDSKGHSQAAKDVRAILDVLPVGELGDVTKVSKVTKDLTKAAAKGTVKVVDKVAEAPVTTKIAQAAAGTKGAVVGFHAGGPVGAAVGASFAAEKAKDLVESYKAIRAAQRAKAAQAPVAPIAKPNPRNPIAGKAAVTTGAISSKILEQTDEQD